MCLNICFFNPNIFLRKVNKLTYFCFYFDVTVKWFVWMWLFSIGRMNDDSFFSKKKFPFLCWKVKKNAKNVMIHAGNNSTNVASQSNLQINSKLTIFAFTVATYAPPPSLKTFKDIFFASFAACYEQMEMNHKNKILLIIQKSAKIGLLIFRKRKNNDKPKQTHKLHRNIEIWWIIHIAQPFFK